MSSTADIFAAAAGETGRRTHFKPGNKGNRKSLRSKDGIVQSLDPLKKRGRDERGRITTEVLPVPADQAADESIRSLTARECLAVLQKRDVSNGRVRRVFDRLGILAEAGNVEAIKAYQDRMFGKPVRAVAVVGNVKHTHELGPEERRVIEMLAGRLEGRPELVDSYAVGATGSAPVS